MPETTVGVAARLELQPAKDGGTWLSLQPPETWSGSAGEWMARTVDVLFGGPDDRVVVASADDVMARAVDQARAGLTDLRRRILA